jgi:hypothetical protein
MTQNHFKYYSIRNHILNRSFLSTSKDRSIAHIFADDNQQQTSNQYNSAKISVLLKYKIKLNQTAIDIEHKGCLISFDPLFIFRISQL